MCLYAAEVDVIVELCVHRAVEFQVYHCSEPFYVFHCGEMVVAFAVGSLVILDAVERVIVAVHANEVSTLHVLVIRAAVHIAVSNPTLRLAVAAVVGYLVHKVAVCHGHGIGIHADGLLEARAFCLALVQQVAETAVGYVFS